VTGHGTPPAAAPHVRGPLAATQEWRLVKVAGVVDTVSKDGDGWRAELVLADGTRVPIVALPRAGVGASALIEDAPGAVVGVVRPPNPSASDRRSAVLPRGPRDVTSGAATSGATTSGGPARGGAAASGRSAAGSGPVAGRGSSSPTGEPGPESPGSSVALDAPDVVPLARLGELVGRRVRVGGTVENVAMRDTAAQVTLRDASGAGTLQLGPALLDVARLVAVGEAINATGTVVASSDGPVVDVVAVEDLQRASALDPASPDPASGSPADTPGASDGATAIPGTAASTGTSPLGVGDPSGLMAALVVALLGLTLLVVGAWPELRRRVAELRSRAEARRATAARHDAG
jgi:hypothetical protein